MTTEGRLTAALELIHKKIVGVHTLGGAASPDDRKELILDLHHISAVALGKTDSVQRTPALTAEAAPLAPPAA
jgi:hypothetical protein